MSLRNKFAAAAIAASLVIGGTAAAMAAPAVSNGWVPVRNHPGGFTVDHLHFGEHVNVTGCAGMWCHIVHFGPDGWVKKYQIHPMYVGYPYPGPGPYGGPWGGPYGGPGFCVGGSGGGSFCVSF